MRSDKYDDERAAQTRRRRKKKKGKSGCLWIFILILAVIVAGSGYYTLGLRPVEPGSEEQVAVTIPNGTGASMIVELLDEAGLVKNKLCAKVNTKIARYNNLQANSYIFNKGMSFPEIMEVINTGDFEYVSKESVEIPDGSRLEQVAAVIAEKLPFTADEFLATWSDQQYLGKLIDKYWFLSDAILNKDVMYPLEGYLYADTYYITDNMTIEAFTEMCLDRMDTELSARKEQIDASGFSVHEFLTLTSIVTKEARSEDQAGVAGVFINRLNQGMSLGSDVTVCYIFQEDRVALKQSQLDSDNPYNTRKFAGLPPGPICQVIGDAMDAVLNYEKSDYLFFIADENGVVRYSEDNSGHNQNIEEYGLVKDEDKE